MILDLDTYGTANGHHMKNCTLCDDRHIGARNDALYLDQEYRGNYPSTHRRRNHVLA